MAGLSGDFAKVESWQRMWRWQAEQFPGALSRGIAHRSVELAVDQFVTQRDPDGNPWKPSKRVEGIAAGRRRKSKYYIRNSLGLTLVDTTELLRSIYPSLILDDRITITAPKIYARIHQEGGTIGGFLAGKGIEMPRRSFFPGSREAGPDLGPIWGPAWIETARHVWLAGFEQNGVSP